jgi:hypothetical protein
VIVTVPTVALTLAAAGNGTELNGGPSAAKVNQLGKNDVAPVREVDARAARPCQPLPKDPCRTATRATATPMVVCAGTW